MTPPWETETVESGQVWCPRCWSLLDYREFEPCTENNMWPEAEGLDVGSTMSMWVTCYVELDDDEPCGEDIWVGRDVADEGVYGPTRNDPIALAESEGPA